MNNGAGMSSKEASHSHAIHPSNPPGGHAYRNLRARWHLLETDGYVLLLWALIVADPENGLLA